MNLEFTITATLRPEILIRTLRSFQYKLLWDGIPIMSRSRVFVNIDPVPNVGIPSAVVDVCRMFFHSVIAIYPREPNFARAVKTLWGMVQADYVFHLEDDWELLEKVELRNIESMFAKGDDLSWVGLRAYWFPQEDTRICLSPGVFRGDDLRSIALNLREDVNPEKQLRPETEDNPNGSALGRLFLGMQYPSRTQPPENERLLVKDIGRDWLAKSGWCKPSDAFNRWERKVAG